MSENITPKQRYDARMKLKRMAKEPDWKADEAIVQDYVFDLAERTVTAIEKIASALKRRV